MKPEEQLEILVDGLRLLAASATEQVQALPDYVCVTDEVMSNFSDAYLLVGQLKAAGLVDNAAADALKAVDDHLGGMPDDDALGDPASLKSHPFWAEARRLASAALAAIGQSSGPLCLRHVRYVK